MIANSPSVLVVEDEAPMRRFLRTFLSTSGYQVTEASSGQEAIAAAARRTPDVVILDLGLPDMDGHDVLIQLREWLAAPVIVLSVRNQDNQKIMALDEGADDYLTKPFSSGELLARIRVGLRHSANRNSAADEPEFASGDLRIDLAARKVFAKDTEIRLTPIEYKLLVTLVKHAGRVLTHQFLLEAIWGRQKLESKQHLRVFMAGLRRKIEADAAQPCHILTEQGVGYRLAVK
jgi:two-component system, OmpR family, KDP operon response regulator KdpE